MADQSPRLNTFFISRLDGRRPRTLEFRSFPPIISDNTSVAWDEIAVPGAADVIRMYKNTSSKTINFQLQFFANGAEGIPFGSRAAEKSADESVKTPVRWLQSLLYPQSQLVDLTRNHPTKVVLTLGSYLTAVCVTSSVNVNLKSPWVGTINNLTEPMYAEVDITFVTFRELVSTSPDADQARQSTPNITEGNVRRGTAWQFGGVPSSKGSVV